MGESKKDEERAFNYRMVSDTHLATDIHGQRGSSYPYRLFQATGGLFDSKPVSAGYY
jgi:hypothetical protein